MQVKDSAGDDTREGVYVSASEVHDLSGSRGVANFVLKWAKDSKREAYLNVEEVKNVTRPLTGAAGAGSWGPRGDGRCLMGAAKLGGSCLSG